MSGSVQCLEVFSVWQFSVSGCVQCLVSGSVQYVQYLAVFSIWQCSVSGSVQCLAVFSVQCLAVFNV